MNVYSYAVWGWASHRGVLGDRSALKDFLSRLVEASKLEALWVCSADVEVQVALLERALEEDEGGAAASIVTSTGHASIHGWPEADPLEDDGAYFTLQVTSCRDFDKNLVMNLARGVLGATRIDTRAYNLLPPPEVPEP